MCNVDAARRGREVMGWENDMDYSEGDVAWQTAGRQKSKPGAGRKLRRTQFIVCLKRMDCHVNAKY